MEAIINEQIRRYNEKMEEIEQLEYAEALAVNQLKLKRQNTVRHTRLHWCWVVSALHHRCVSLIVDLIVDVTAQHHKKAHYQVPTVLHPGNTAHVPCFPVALLAFTAQVLTSLQRSGGMYLHSRPSRCSSVGQPVGACAWHVGRGFSFHPPY